MTHVDLRDKDLLCLVDGEHYPPVIEWCLDHLRDRGASVKALVFLGGSEKVGNAAEELKGEYLVILGGGSFERTLAIIGESVDRTHPDMVVDLSDEPVLTYRDRFRIASVVLRRGVPYMGADFMLWPPEAKDLLDRPSLSIIGTGKRVGKTAVSTTVARILDSAGHTPVIVAMGRGGPPDPVVLLPQDLDASPSHLIDVSLQGVHAASDYWEDAVLARVPTIGCRRCGGGMAGSPFLSNVEEGVERTRDLPSDLVIMEGSGSTLPPVRTDLNLLVVGAGQPLEYITGYLGEYRVLLSDMAIVTMCEEPVADRGKVGSILEGLRDLRPDMEVALTVFRPQPLEDVSGRRVFVATTAPAEVGPRIRDHLEGQGCEVVGMSHHLSHRGALRDDLKQGLARADTLLTEIKASSIEVAATEATRAGAGVVFMHNQPVLVGGTVDDLEEAIVTLWERANRWEEG